jgi:hypothetical protein
MNNSKLKLGAVVKACNPAPGSACINRRIEFKASLGYRARPCLKINKQKTYT